MHSYKSFKLYVIVSTINCTVENKMLSWRLNKAQHGQSITFWWPQQPTFWYQEGTKGIGNRRCWWLANSSHWPLLPRHHPLPWGWAGPSYTFNWCNTEKPKAQNFQEVVTKGCGSVIRMFPCFLTCPHYCNKLPGYELSCVIKRTGQPLTKTQQGTDFLNSPGWASSCQQYELVWKRIPPC